MSVLQVERAMVEPPSSLPLQYLSVSSLTQLMKCPEAWRRKYIDHDPEPSSGKMVLGSAAHAALAQYYGHQLESGQGFGVEQLLDEFSSEWENRTEREEVDFEHDTPGALKDSGAAALRIYLAAIAPGIVPTSVEREFELSWPGAPFKLTGYIDLEDAANLVRDSKMTTRRIAQPAADGDLQATVLLAARRAEGNPADGFRFDMMLRQAQPKAEVVATGRSEHQLDLLTDRIFGLAREIEWRCETGIWSGASPNTWFCSSCRYVGCPLRLA